MTSQSVALSRFDSAGHRQTIAVAEVTPVTKGHPRVELWDTNHEHMFSLPDTDVMLVRSFLLELADTIYEAGRCE